MLYVSIVCDVLFNKVAGGSTCFMAQRNKYITNNERILNNLLHMILKNKNDSDMCFTTRMITLPETNIGPEN